MYVLYFTDIYLKIVATTNSNPGTPTKKVLFSCEKQHFFF